MRGPQFNLLSLLPIHYYLSISGLHILAGFTFNNRALLLPAIVFIEHDWRRPDFPGQNAVFKKKRFEKEELCYLLFVLHFISAFSWNNMWLLLHYFTPERLIDFLSPQFEKEKKWSKKTSEQRGLEPETIRSKIFGLFTWAICELMNEGGKKSIKSFRWPPPTTCTSTALASVRYAQTQSFCFALFE